MKILYLCADPGIPVFATKGASVHVRSLVSAFRRAGHDVTLVAPVLMRTTWRRSAPTPSGGSASRAMPHGLRAPTCASTR